MKKYIEYLLDRENEQLQFIQHLLATYAVVFMLSLISFASDLPTLVNVHASELSLFTLLDQSEDKTKANLDAQQASLPLHIQINNRQQDITRSNDAHRENTQSDDMSLIVKTDESATVMANHEQQIEPITLVKASDDQVENKLNHVNNASQRIFRFTSTSVASDSNGIDSGNSSSGASASASVNTVNTASVNNQSQQALNNLGIQSGPDLLTVLSEQAKLKLPNQHTNIALPNNNTQAANIETFKQYYPEFFQNNETSNSGLNLNRLDPIAPGSLNDPINCPDVNRYFSSPEARAGARANQIARGCS